MKNMHSAIPEEKLTEAYRLLLDAELSGKVSQLETEGNQLLEKTEMLDTTSEE